MTDRDQRFTDTNNSQEVTPAQPAPLGTNQIVIDEPILPPTNREMVTRVKNKIGRLHLFAAFCENPINVSFQTQEADEHVLLFLRKSQWANAAWIITTLLFLFIPLLAYSFQGLFTQYAPPSLPVFLILVPLYYLFVITYAFVNFVTWYYNAALVTDKRIIDINFHQIVLKDVAETKLALVQDVSYKQDGVLPNIFGYGYILIQTAGTLDNFEFYSLPEPARIVEIVEGLIGGKRYYEP